ncbi:Crp/Fnr family transcriptional regulator [Catellatospora bangladeshensis]|uniref:Crp/Fnr family transcriptional regulator n=1 Tax=Catellatospora bangladeshensis TaxID=310355 RepID=A0A8J3JFP1_9ACTN|nr:Crp/Fnr family transcriptional regulator [Catellatospora bangladeshensis]GIF81794.1 Crp/Fnr family transcriptional regulator [Catellatospora bangladeshensis]
MSGDFWALLTPAEQEAFTRHSMQRRWTRGEVLCREGDSSDWVAMLRAGRVKASSHTASGAEVVLAVRGPGALLGELSAVDRAPRSATLAALEPVTALVMLLPEFEAYLQAHGRVAILLMRLLSERLRDADRKRVEFGAQDSTGRVAARLVELAERFGRAEGGAIAIALPLSQDELAGWVGASREAVSKALGVLRTNGWVRTSRMQVTVLDLAALRTRAGLPRA